MSNRVLVGALVVGCLLCCANGEESRQPYEREAAKIEVFFKDFVEALNSKDVGRIKKMSGGAWGHFSERIECKEKILSIEILSVSTNKMTNVVTKITVGRDNNSPRSAEVVFAMNNVGGIYSIAQMTVPGIEKRNQELDDARRSLEQLVVAINGRSIEVVKGLVSFGGAVDFDAELSARGLSWIKEAIDNCVNAPKYNMSASREGRDSVIGRVYVPSVPGGTNVLRKVVFKGVKIDRAAPLEEARN